MSIPKHLITTWVCDPAHDRYTDAQRALFASCLQSWLKLMPDYQLTVITRGNLWTFGRDQWIEQQVKRGQYIGASNWARLLWLERLGGIYVDMDVEAMRRFDDLLTGAPCVVGCYPGGRRVNNAVIAAEAGHPLLRTLLSRIQRCNPADAQFGNTSGPYLLTTALKQRGWTGQDESVRLDDVQILSSAAFYPYHWKTRYDPACITPETYALHRWAMSWFPQAGLPEVRCAS